MDIFLLIKFLIVVVFIISIYLLYKNIDVIKIILIKKVSLNMFGLPLGGFQQD